MKEFSKHKQKIKNEKHVRYRQNLKQTVFMIYSSEQIKCADCSESDLTVLTIDHKNNDGSKHRETIGTGTQFYKWLRQMGYPEGYQVLCFNCNMKKSFLSKRNDKTKEILAHTV
jgi:hypothetical protein